MRIPNRTRAVLSTCAGLALLATPACHSGGYGAAGDDLVTVAPKWIKGAQMLAERAEHGGVRVSIESPSVPGARTFTSELRTIMAETQTEFLTRGKSEGDAELDQKATFLAATPDVLGARVVSTRTTATGTEESGTTRWYDTAKKTVLPWTALFSDEASVTVAGAETARRLREQHGVDEEGLPAGLPTVSPEEPQLPAAPKAVAPKDAEGLAAKLADSPLDDIGFTSSGALAVNFSPGEIPGRDEKVQVVFSNEGTDPLLSEFGMMVRDAAKTTPEQKVDLGGSAADAHKGPGLDCSRVPCVALTFDDGPGEYTEGVLDELSKYSARATFFVLGTMVREMPDVVARTAEAGHEIGNHTWDHADLSGVSESGVRKDLARTSDAIEKAAGVRPAVMRPPYGSYDEATLKAIGMPAILWDVDTMDWQSRDTKKITDIALKQAAEGSIVLMHDIHEPSAKALPGILSALHQKGYHFVTVSELFGDGGMKSAMAYLRRE
ncbi:polysaccharide deacetylase family protein [Nocardiopsis sediminis]|uniref:Polysaccharide deacetylase family protein n=1 Tax=Nocardiopsis sediminis TaxID=1778267 RepID=A0ABV8FGC0_9ACTN